MKRGATSLVWIVVLIIFIIGIIILVPFSNTLAGFIYGSAEDRACQISVLKHASVRDITILKTTGPAIECKRKHITFFDDHVELNGKTMSVYEGRTDESRVSSFKSLNSDIVNFVLAEELYSCWKRMGRGEIHVFNVNFLLNSADGLFTLHSNPCLVCAEIEFKDVTKGKKFTGLEQYLKSTKIEHKDAEGERYYDYLKSMIFVKEVGWIDYGKYPSFGDDTVFEFNSEENYMIYFKAFKTTRFADLTDAEEHMYSVHINDLKNVVGSCSILYN
jgi:hypothetical protein